MKFTVVIAAFVAAALTMCSAAAAQAPTSAPETAPPVPATDQTPATAPPNAGMGTDRPGAPSVEIAAVPIEESSVPLRGAVVGVPVPGLTRELYIGLGAAHQVAAGDYFLAYNPAVRAIAVLKIVRVQDRMSAAESLAQLASLRNGDSVKRITARSALSLARQIESLTAGAPPLSASVLIDADLLAASRAIESKGAPGLPGAIPAPAPVAAHAVLPDMAGVGLQAKVSEAGIGLNWRAPASGGESIVRYVIYRSKDPKGAGTRLAEISAPATRYEDASELEKGTYIYRLAAIDAEGRESGLFPSIEVEYSPAKKKMLLGKKTPRIKTKTLPAFINPAAGISPAPGVIPPVAAAAIPTGAAPAAPAPTAGSIPPPQVPAAPAPEALPPPASSPVTAPVAGAALPPVAPPLPSPAETSAPLPAATPPAAPQAAAPPLPAAPPAAAPDAAPPVPPEEAQAAAALPAPGRFSARVEGTTVDMSWNPISTKEKLAGYLIYRGTPGDESGASLNSKPISKTSYRDRSARMGESYYYWVVAQTVEGALSAPSRKVKVDMPKSKGVVPFF